MIEKRANAILRELHLFDLQRRMSVVLDKKSERNVTLITQWLDGATFAETARAARISTSRSKQIVYQFIHDVRRLYRVPPEPPFAAHYSAFIAWNAAVYTPPDPETVKLRSRQLAREALTATYFQKYEHGDDSWLEATAPPSPPLPTKL